MHKINHCKYFFESAYTGKLDIVKLFVENGFDIDVKDEKGETPLFKAVIGSNYNICKYLHENGAKLDIVNNKNLSLKHFVRTIKHKLIFNYFDQAHQLDKIYYPESPIVLKSHLTLTTSSSSSTTKLNLPNDMKKNPLRKRNTGKKEPSLITVGKAASKHCCSFIG